MKRHWLAVRTPVLGAALLTVVRGLAAEEPPIGLVPSGVVAAHMVGRVLVAADGVCEVVGYHAFIDGLGQPFAGEAGEKTAYFSVRSAPFRMRPVLNGTTVHLFAVPLTGSTVPLHVYYDPSPDRDFSYPESFSAGQLVATFHPRGGMASLSPLGVAAYNGSLDLVASTPFSFAGRSVDFRSLGETVTADLQGEAPVFGGPYLGLAFPFGGPVVAAGDHFITARGLRARRLHPADYP
jgi:hypothetical protein